MIQLSFFLARSYKWFFLLIGLVFVTQVFLAFKSFRLSTSHTSNGFGGGVDVLPKQQSVGSVSEDDDDSPDGRQKVPVRSVANKTQLFDWGVLGFEPACNLRYVELHQISLTLCLV